ncbi:response regulator [Steroidobacter cummioxidans]|uniref:hybrid sensor histidine kinase/response regulator n=1 Tax=Steroidobacter cummioxidans TaxID=1803913 RepID=UPI000E321684|nr:response regulator [Steroidobacter cummioxidans]
MNQGIDTDSTRDTSSSVAPVAAAEARPRTSILLVDDQPARLLTYEAVLSGIDVDCVRALSGRDALKQLLTRDFALILLDVNMPDMDGFETARLIREHPRWERTPIIFVTGMNVSELDQLKGYEVGAIDYIPVPVVPEILRSKVTVLVELHQRRRYLEALNTSLTQARSDLEIRHASALAERDAQLHAIFEHPTELFVVLQAVRGPCGTIVDFQYRDANTNSLELLGYGRDQLRGCRLTELFDPEAASRMIAQSAQVLQTRQIVRYEAQHRDKDFFITLFPMGPECVVSSGTNITERKRAEAALRHSEARHRALLDHAPVGVAHNSLDGRFEYVNHAFCKLVGYSPEELHNKRWQDLTHPQDVAQDQELANQVITGKLTDYTIQKRYVRKDGSIVWVNLFGNFVADDAGRPVQGVAIVIDITEQIDSQRLLRESEARWREANTRKDEFLAMLSHELRNPAAAIGNAAQALSRLTVNRDQEQALIGIVKRQIGHLGHLLDDLLEVSRITQGRIEINRERLTLQSCIDSAIETAQPLMQEKKHRLTSIVCPEPLWVYADKVRLAQCIANLLTNAARYTKPGGEIQVRAMIEDDAAVVAIIDNGIGMPAELISRVFELFVQGERALDRSQGGLGIGLAVCRMLIEMQGGTAAASSPGIDQGSTFTLRLPLAIQAHDASTEVSADNGGPARVMIIDDNRDAADSLALLLQLEAHATLTAYSGATALDQAEGFDPQFVLLDIGLPEMDGYEVARRLKAICPRARLIAVTGYGLAGDKQRSADSGFAAHLVKPVNLTDIQTAFTTLTS